MSGSLILAGFLAILIAFILLALGINSKGSFQTGETKIGGAAWFVLFVLGILLIAGGAYLP